MVAEIWQYRLAVWPLRAAVCDGDHTFVAEEDYDGSQPVAVNADLRRWGLQLAERGGKNAKKRPAVAVARKLAVLLHKLWVSGEDYEPLWNNQQAAVA